MAKVSGLTTSVSVGGSAIGPDITSFTLDTPYGVQDVTGLDKSAIERLLLRADASGTLNGVFNAALSHTALKTPGSKAFVIAFAAAAATATFTAVTTNYALSMGADGSLTWSCNFALASGTAVAWT